MAKLFLKISLVIFGIGLLVALFKLGLPGNTILLRTINNALHFPFFGVLALSFFAISSLFLGKIVRDPLMHYLAAFVLAVSVGALHEISQIIGPRDADLGDLARDAAGAITFLGIYMVHDRRLKKIRLLRYKKAKILIYLCAFAVASYIFMPSGLWAAAYLNRNLEFPVICDFESYWSRKFLITKDAILKVAPAPYSIEGFGENKIGNLTFLEAEYPKLAIEEPYPDWTDYNSLIFDVYSELDSEMTLSILIEDSHFNGDYRDRFNKSMTVYPGLNEIIIGLNEIEWQLPTRRMDLADIRAILLYMYRPREQLSIYIDNLRLAKNQ